MCLIQSTGVPYLIHQRAYKICILGSVFRNVSWTDRLLGSWICTLLQEPNPLVQLTWLRVSYFSVQLGQQICSGRKIQWCSDPFSESSSENQSLTGNLGARSRTWSSSCWILCNVGLAIPMLDLHHQFWVQMVINVFDHHNDVQRGQCMAVYQNQLEDFEGQIDSYQFQLMDVFWSYIWVPHASCASVAPYCPKPVKNATMMTVSGVAAGWYPTSESLSVPGAARDPGIVNRSWYRTEGLGVCKTF